MHRIPGENKWKAQMSRQGVVLSLGQYASPEAAADAYDNASYHLRHWSDRALQYNAEDMEELKKSEPTASTLRALALLRERYPDYERQMEADAALSEVQRSERDGLNAIEATLEGMRQVRVAVSTAYGRMKGMEKQLEAANAKIAQQERVIASLRASGGKSFFRPVIPVPEPTEPIPERTGSPEGHDVPQILDGCSPIESHLS